MKVSLSWDTKILSTNLSTSTVVLFLWSEFFGDQCSTAADGMLQDDVVTSYKIIDLNSNKSLIGFRRVCGLSVVCGLSIYVIVLLLSTHAASDTFKITAVGKAQVHTGLASVADDLIFRLAHARVSDSFRDSFLTCYDGWINETSDGAPEAAFVTMRRQNLRQVSFATPGAFGGGPDGVDKTRILARGAGLVTFTFRG